MTGENFIRINRKDEHLADMLNGLNELRNKWSVAYHDTESDDYFAILAKLEEKIERLKYNIYTYVYNRNCPNYTYIKEFERKYLW